VFVFGKIFNSIFDSTLCSDGGFLPTYVLIALITLADKEGNVEITPKALFTRIGFRNDGDDISYERFEEALRYLQQEDKDSNLPNEEGRRIIPLSKIPDHDGNRGFRVVNYEYYRDKGGSLDQRRKQDAERKRRQRKNKKTKSSISDSHSHRTVTGRHVTSAHIDTDIDTDIDIEREEDKQTNSLPDDFWYTHEMVAEAKAEGLNIDFETETRKFIDRALSEGTKSLNWEAALRNWWRRAKEYKRGNPTPSQDEQNRESVLGLADLFKFKQEPGESWEVFEARVTEMNNRRLEKLKSR
jgi:hypothetical protein